MSEQRAELRTCMAVSLYPPAFGGHGIQWQRNAPLLRARGIAPTVLTKRHDGTAASADATPVHRALSPGFSAASKARRVAELRRYFRAHRGDFDLVHAAFLGWELLLNVGYLRRLGLPVIVEMVLLGTDDLDAIAAMRLGALKLRLLRQVDAWIGISRTFLPPLLAHGMPEDRFHLMPFGVDLERHRPRSESERRELRRKLDLPLDARVAVSVGSVIARKGMDRLVAGWARTRPVAGRDLLVLVGPASVEDGLHSDSTPFCDELRRRAESAELAGTVRFAGRSDLVHEYMGAADAFALLSRREGLGAVILEAMASGLPCAVSPLDGIAEELIEPGRSGVIVVEPDAPDAVAAALSGVLGDAEARRRMGAEARRTAEARFSMERRADLLAALYRELTGRGVRRPARRGPTR